MWLTDLFSAPYLAKISGLEATVEVLRKDNDELRARLRDFELDERETRRGLLTRLGILAAPKQNGDKEVNLKPIKKATVPWHVQAARVEADSRERYWKKVIEDQEKPQEQRKSEAESKISHEISESEQIQADVEELSR
jgi:hypothetical protein